MEFNADRYKECDDVHDWGYGMDSGNCLHCGLIHNCEVDDKYEFDGNHYICSVCHIFPSTQVLKEIEEANADARDAELEYRSNLL